MGTNNDFSYNPRHMSEFHYNLSDMKKCSLLDEYKFLQIKSEYDHSAIATQETFLRSNNYIHSCGFVLTSISYHTIRIWLITRKKIELIGFQDSNMRKFLTIF